MKKKWIALIVIMIVVMCVGCGEKKTNSSEEYDINVWEKGVANICKSENGYYAVSGEFIYTIENEGIYPLCNKADCDHKNKECNAYLRKVCEQTIWYDGEHIYAVASEKSGKFSVYEINADGSGSSRICDVFQTTGGVAGYSISCAYKDNYIYYDLELPTAEDARTGQYSGRLYRLRLESGAEPELIYESSDDKKKISTSVGRLYFYGDDLYTVVLKYENSGDGRWCELYRYSTKEDTFEMVLDRFMSHYFMKDDILYYTSEDGIHKYAFDGSVDELLVENPEFCGVAIFDGTYMYVDDEWYQCQQEKHSDKKNIYVLDLSGNIIKKITTDWEMEVLYGDGESIVETRKDPVNTENGSWFVDNFYFYDKAQIITDQDEWTCIEQKAIEDLQQ
ncbi:MAG: hypothetical protein SO015_09065 [Wujia sp.]|nr:hypothetical protein [Wujia sp.]MDY3728287.1 hypothetical protein [Wujia sp.]